MTLIREIVQQALTTGYLSLEAENRLRLLLKTKYEVEDFKAFMRLQAAAFEGMVKQESRELMKGCQTSICKTSKLANRMHAIR
ncbi:MAG TPA: hypothetical protein V6C85_18600 [Allocoleopsis sp.]|jgi:hypothetical protein